jgi:hypothetical protein
LGWFNNNGLVDLGAVGAAVSIGGAATPAGSDVPVPVPAASEESDVPGDEEAF